MGPAGRFAAVSAVLAEDYEERCLWQAQVDPPATAHELPADSVDVLVVGAGICGLAAADAAASRGRSVVVVDREPLGWGASSRNGGMVIPELKAGPAALAKKYGTVGTRMHEEVVEAFEFVEASATGTDGRGGIDCDWSVPGELYLAHSVHHVEHLRAMTRELSDAGEAVHFVERNDLHTEIGSEAFVGGVVLERTGAVHPAKLHAGLARRAMASGAVVCDRTAVESVTAERGGHTVRTTRGTIRANDVIIATNAAADSAVPELERRVLPIGSFIIATEVLDPELAASVSPTGRMMVDTRNFLAYWRLTPDGRLAFGGRRNMEPVEIAEARDFLYGRMVDIHPQLAGVPIRYAWGGHVAMTLDRLPHVGQLDGAWYATGCNGSGVALNTWLGHRLGLVVCGEAAPPAVAELRHRPIPIRSLRSAYLPIVGRWFSFQDAR